jgi:hypothetical protein
MIIEYYIKIGPEDKAFGTTQARGDGPPGIFSDLTPSSLLALSRVDLGIPPVIARLKGPPLGFSRAACPE